MSFKLQTEVTCYLLPGDGDEAKADFLANVKNPYETWILAYALTLDSLIEELLEAHAAGVKIHLYLDYSQAQGVTEKPKILQLAQAGMDVTIGTSTAGKAYISHSKGVVVDVPGAPWCWSGSVNFSDSGWKQVNTATVFISQEWRDHFVAQFEELKAYAWENEKAFQLIPAPPPGN